jgi:hypothetical protein
MHASHSNHVHVARSACCQITRTTKSSFALASFKFFPRLQTPIERERLTFQHCNNRESPAKTNTMKILLFLGLLFFPAAVQAQALASTTTTVDSSPTSNTGNTLSEIVTDPAVIEDPPAVSLTTTTNVPTTTSMEAADEDEDEGEESGESDSLDSESGSVDSESVDSESDSEDSESDSEDSFGTSNGASSVNSDFSFLNQGSSIRQLWIWHGVLMAISWGILVPLAIGSSLLRDTLNLPPGVWLMMHISLNMFAILCMVVSFGIAVYATNLSTVDGENSNHFSDLKHGTLGLVIIILAFMQAAVGMMRPNGPKKLVTPVEVPKDVEGTGEMVAVSSNELERTLHSNDASLDEEVSSNTKTSGKSIARRIWEYKHRIMGLGLLVLSWYNCDSGLWLFAERYGENNDFSGAFWGVTGGFSGLICILYAAQIARR